MPKLSIITINYNNLEGLRKTVESVVNQTWQEFEYIVIDGGSTDGSAAYLQSQEKLFDYWISEPDSGIYNAMNKGIAKATGEYLLFLNSGDHLFSNLVLYNNWYEISDFDLVTFNLKVVIDNEEKDIVFPNNIKFLDLYISSFFSVLHPATFIKKDFLIGVGLFDEKFKIISDWKFFMIALFKFNCSYKKINCLLTVFYSGGISSTIDNSKERDVFLNEEFGGFLDDYDELLNKRAILNTNRFRMLNEIEKSYFGRKIVSLFFRFFLIIFSRKKIKNIIDQNVKKDNF